jgi:glycosyltransferase involved in cell wall biosynthesis
MLSVMVPSWNYGCFLGEAIASLVACRPAFDDILIVDDCSSDQTADLGSYFAGEVGSVRYVRNDQRRGIVWNLNTYLPTLRSEWVCMVSADDWVDPRFVAAHEAAIAAFGADPKVALIYSGARYTVTHAPTERADLDGLVVGLDEWDPVRLRTQNYIHGSAVIRKAALVAIGGFPDVPVEEDHACWKRFAAGGYVGRSVGFDEPLLFYRQHDRGHRNYGTDGKREKGDR